MGIVCRLCRVQCFVVFINVLENIHSVIISILDSVQWPTCGKHGRREVATSMNQTVERRHPWSRCDGHSERERTNLTQCVTPGLERDSQAKTDDAERVGDERGGEMHQPTNRPIKPPNNVGVIRNQGKKSMD